ncbi:MAG: hypothetical protein ACOX9R_10420 [Armatimonadota bacterium]|jgi:hypothetical protein
MRMAGAVTLGVVIVEALLAGAFVLGFFWLEGLQWGLLFSGLLLLLIVIPWLGELKVVFDSAGPRGAVRVGWWGRVSFTDSASATHLVIRIIGIPIRRRIEKKKPEGPERAEERDVVETPAAAEPTAEERAPECEAKKTRVRRARWWERLDSETIEGFGRAIGSAVGATCELVWGADEIRVSVQDPAQRESADAVIEQVFGRRQIGPADLTLARGGGRRRVRAVYRIGLLRAALAGAQVVIDGRVPQLARRMKRAGVAGEVEDEDQRIIEEIVEQGRSREEDGD